MKTSDKIKKPTLCNDDPVLVSHEFLNEMSSEVAKLEEALHQEDHTIVFSDDGSWSIQHLVECRPDMTKCEIHKQAQMDMGGRDVGLRGIYKVSILDGVLDFGRISE